jgi:hypothetical protein
MFFSPAVMNTMTVTTFRHLVSPSANPIGEIPDIPLMSMMVIVPDPGKGVCADPVNGVAILREGGAGSSGREQGALVEPRQGKREDVIE